MARAYEVSAQDAHSLPVHAPTELDDDEYARYLDDGSAYGDQILAALSNIDGRSVLVTMLFLGKDVQSAQIGQGLYFRGLRYNTARLRARLEALGSFRNVGRQLALANDLIRPTANEVREVVVGWQFREVD